MTKRQQILTALYSALLDPENYQLTKNEPLIDFSSANFATLHDGEVDNTETFFNPPTYEFTMTPSVVLAVKGDNSDVRDVALEALILAVVAKCAAITDLGDLITDIRPQPANYTPRGLFGGTDMKLCELGIELDYWTDSSAG